MSWRNDRDRIADAIMAGGGDNPWDRLPSSENIELGGPLPPPTWDEGFGPQGWQNIYGRMGGTTGGSEFYTSNDSVDNATGLAGEMGNQDIYNQTLANIYNMNLSNEGVEPPYFDPALNAGNLGGAPGAFDASPYDDAGSSGIPGSYGAPGGFGRHRRAGL